MTELAPAPPLLLRARRGFDVLRGASVRVSDGALPLLVEPEAPGVDLAAWAATARETIAGWLRVHGAIRFGGFDVGGPSELERFAEAAGTTLFGDYGDLPRVAQGGKVYGTTPYPADQAILFHNESSHQHRWPRRIFFLCLVAAESGGATPLVDGRRVHDALPPGPRERFLRAGLRYVRNFTPGIDVPWQDFFRTSDRGTVESACRASGAACEWKPDGGLRVEQRAPAVVRHPETGEAAFFNQIQLHHPSRLAPEVRESLLELMDERDLPRNVTFGDGAPIPDELVDEVAAITERLAVDPPWREGDVLMLDNRLVAHGRRPYTGERKVVVTMGDMENAPETAPAG